MDIKNVGQNVNASRAVKSNPAQVKSAEVKKVDLDKTVRQEIHQMNKKEKEEALAIDQKVLDKSIKQANKELKMYNRRIDREIHEKTHAMMYKIVDTKTDEVIREFPPKKIQDMIAKMWELAGLFVDEEV